MPQGIEAPAGTSAEGQTSHTLFRFESAAKEARPVRAVLDGPPGSGRTLAALKMAAELGERIAVIDTERGKSRQYAALVPFEVIEMASFHPSGLSLALYAAAGFDVVVIDCGSAFWSGPEGHLEQVDLASQRVGGGNVNAGWREMRPLERQMLEAVMCFPGHVVMTLRDKLDVVLRPDASGHLVPTRVSLRPEQISGLEYEVDFAATLLPTHELVVTKSSAPGLANEVLEDASAAGKALAEWAAEGTPRGPRQEFLQRAYDPEATYESLSQLAVEIRYHRSAGMAAIDPNGQPTTLAEVISFRLSRAYRRQKEAARTAAVPEGSVA